MLHDLMPDVVTISFGSRTDAIFTAAAQSRLELRRHRRMAGRARARRVLCRRSPRDADCRRAGRCPDRGRRRAGDRRNTSLVTPRVGLSPPLPADAKRKAPELDAPGPFLLTGKEPSASARPSAERLLARRSRTLSSPPPMSIFRGFIASGISRTSSIASRPSFRSAPRTWIWSASAKRRSNERVAIPR